MNQCNILIIDNNHVFSKSLRNLILEVTKCVGINIQCVYNDIDFITIIKKNDFHFIFWNVDMPDFQETWKYFNEIKKKVDSKVVGITFHPDQKEWFKKNFKGISTYLIKDAIEPINILKIIK